MKKLILILVLISLVLPTSATARESDQVMRFDNDKDGDIDLIDLLWWMRRAASIPWSWQILGDSGCDCDETAGGGGGGGAG